MEKEIENVSMRNAENGVVISYCECMEAPTKGTYDNKIREYKDEVFKFPSEFDDAIKRFKELFLLAREED